MNDSHYRDGKKFPRESRTIPLPGNRWRGNGLDHGRYYECWWCGFTCNIDRDSLGGARSRGGDEHEDFSTTTYTPTDGISSPLCVLGGSINSSHVVMENGADGNPKSIRHNHKSVIAGGCPFCGCKNWLGKYP